MKIKLNSVIWCYSVLLTVVVLLPPACHSKSKNLARDQTGGASSRQETPSACGTGPAARVCIADEVCAAVDGEGPKCRTICNRKDPIPCWPTGRCMPVAGHAEIGAMMPLSQLAYLCVPSPAVDLKIPAFKTGSLRFDSGKSVGRVNFCAKGVVEITGPANACIDYDCDRASYEVNLLPGKYKATISGLDCSESDLPKGATKYVGCKLSPDPVPFTVVADKTVSVAFNFTFRYEGIAPLRVQMKM